MWINHVNDFRDYDKINQIKAIDANLPHNKDSNEKKTIIYKRLLFWKISGLESNKTIGNFISDVRPKK